MMNLRVTTKELNASGKLFIYVDGENAHLLRCAECHPGQTGAVKLGYNYGYYGWNYDLYMLVKKTGIYYIVTGYRNFPKRLVKWSREDLEKALAAE